MIKHPWKRRDFLKSLGVLGGSSAIASPFNLFSSQDSQEKYMIELEKKFLESLDLSEQISTLKNLEESSIENTKFAEEFEKIENFIKNEINPPRIEVDYSETGFCPPIDKVIMSLPSVETWIKELQRGIPSCHHKLYHEKIHLLDDNYSEKDKLDDILCKHNFFTRNKSFKNFINEYELFTKMVGGSSKIKRRVIKPFLIDYKNTFDLKVDSLNEVFDDFKKRWEKYSNLMPQFRALTEIHAYFCSFPLGYEHGTLLTELEKTLCEKAYKSTTDGWLLPLQIDTQTKNQIQNLISNLTSRIQILYGILLKRNVQITDAHIEVSKIVGESMYNFDYEKFYYPKLEKAVIESTDKFKVTPKEARDVIAKIWIPYRAEICQSVKKATEKYLKDNFGLKKKHQASYGF